MRLISLSPELAEHLGVDVAEVAGQPLTRALRLDENEAGEMPLISALAARRGFTGQRARSRTDESRMLSCSGEVVTAADGASPASAGLRQLEAAASAPDAQSSSSADFDHALDEVLRSPLDRIIESAERIVERADGPLRSDYASYGNDIAAAARHLLSVVRSMSEDPAQGQRAIDLAALAAEAVVMLESSAEEREVTIELEADRTASRERAGARGHPDPGQPDRQCRSPFARGRHGAAGVRPDAGNGFGDRRRRGPGNRAGRPAAHLRALRAGRAEARAAPASASPSRAGSRARWAAT